MTESVCVYSPKPPDVEAAQSQYRVLQTIKALCETERLGNVTALKREILAAIETAIPPKKGA